MSRRRTGQERARRAAERRRAATQATSSRALPLRTPPADIQRLQKELERYLEGLTPSNVEHGAQDLMSAAAGGATAAELTTRLYEVLGGGDRSFIWTPRSGGYAAGTIFWRARRFADPSEFGAAFQTHTGAWEPPAAVRPTAGRVNRPGEAVLYTCAAQPQATLPEARIASGEPFALIKYRAVRAVRVGDLRSPATPEDLSALARQGHRAMNDFFRVIFNGAGDQAGAYVLSEIVAKHFFDLPHQDAWIYESVLAPSECNVAFQAAKAHDCLELVGVALQRTCPSHGVGAHTFGIPAGGTFEWGPMGSAVQQAAFPDFT